MPSRVLILTQDTIYGDHLHIRLEAGGHQVKFASNPIDLPALTAEKWDVIISECQFGGMDPTQWMSQLNPKQNTVYFYTDQFTSEEAGRWKDLGVKDVFPKLRRGDLLKAVQTYLEGAPNLAGMTGAKGVAQKLKKFLVVDDSPTIRKFVRKALETGFPGSEIFEAEDGKTAMRELTGQKMDLIVTDMQMPGVDGMSFIKTLHRNPLLGKKPIVILSGTITKEMKEDLGTVPTVRILMKPADPRAIVNTIEGLLSSESRN